MNYDAVLFDLDGTLLDTLHDLADSCNHAMAAMGYPLHSADAVRGFINNGAKQLITAACPAATPGAEVDRCLVLFRAHYRANLANKTAPYPGVLAVLDALAARGVKVGVVSNKPDAAVKALCAQYFGARVGAAVGEHEADGVRRKPAPDTVFEALCLLDAARDKSLYVGDSDVDIETARNAGLPCLAVSWGFRPRESLVAAGATHIVDAVGDLLEAMDNR